MEWPKWVPILHWRYRKMLTYAAAIVNGTLYMYGFRTTTDAKQTDNTWSMSPFPH